jgi:hypothetical protein
MAIFLFADNASTALASGIGTSDTTCTVTATTGSEFPAPGAGQQVAITFEDVSGDIEIVYCTGRTGDTLTIVRAQEGTTARAFASGTIVENRVTKGSLNAFLQKNGGDTITGTTTVSGVLQLGSGGSIQGGEYAGGYVRSGAGVTAGEIYVSAGVPYSGTSVLLTSANIASNLPSNVDFCRSGMILFWYGLITAIPSGWQLCNGFLGTPNLEDQFIVGGGGALPTSGTYSAATGSTTLVATNSGYAMTLGDLPNHVHPFDYFSGGGGTIIGVPGFAQVGTEYITIGTGSGSRVSFAGSPNTGNGTNAHTHTITGTAHTHSQSIPYVALFPIMKL